MTVKKKVDIGKLLTTYIPMLCSIIFIVHAICTFKDIELQVFSYVGGTSVLVWIYFLYNSYLYNLCSHQRMFIYYLICSNLVAIYDNYIGIPLNDLQYLMIFIAGFGIAVILYGYLKFRENKIARLTK